MKHNYRIAMAADKENNDLTYHCIDYHPYYSGRNPKHSPESESQSLAYLKNPGYAMTPAKEELIEKIGNWLISILGNQDDVVIAIAPGHSPDSAQNFLHPIVGSLLDFNIKDGRDLLIRTKKVPKAAHGGPRDQDLHEKTIEVKDPARVKNEVVYILDDVWTSGSTLRACASLMRAAGAKDVKLLAVGKTVTINMYEY